MDEDNLKTSEDTIRLKRSIGLSMPNLWWMMMIPIACHFPPGCWSDSTQPTQQLAPKFLVKERLWISVHHMPSQYRTACICIIHKPNTIPTKKCHLKFKVLPLQIWQQFTIMWKDFEQQVPFYAATEQAQDNSLTEQKLDRSCARLQTSSTKSIALFVQHTVCVHHQHKMQYNCCISMCIRQL
jgi:hypothetical protein